jgi:hypothetical protein
MSLRNPWEILRFLQAYLNELPSGLPGLTIRHRITSAAPAHIPSVKSGPKPPNRYLHECAVTPHAYKAAHFFIDQPARRHSSLFEEATTKPGLILGLPSLGARSSA